jgi:predicted DNA-binding WGR domain protein
MWREFRQNSGTKCRTWRIKVVGAQIHTQWGQLDGAIQEAVETKEGVNIGKKNEISPENYAADRAQEIIRKKKREGYREYKEGLCIDVDVPVLINFDEELPESLCFYKPDNSMGPGIMEKANSGKVLYTRKRNGLAYVIVKDNNGKVKMYSRRMLRYHDLQQGEYSWEHRFPYIKGVADYLMPNKSIILGELVFDMKGIDNFKAVQSITKTIHPECMTRQLELSNLGNVAFYTWDIAFWDGKDLVSNTTTKSRYDLIQTVFSEGPWIIPIETFSFDNPSKAMDYLKEKDWEGFVVVDPEGEYGEKAYNFKGRPDRPRSFCAKLKPEFEDDFIVLWNPAENIGEKSTKGRYNGGIKSVSLYQYDTKGNLVYIANCSSGMTEEMKRDWADPKLYPQVWQVIYTDRRYISQGDETNAIDFPRFSMVRTDKNPNECVNSELDLQING